MACASSARVMECSGQLELWEGESRKRWHRLERRAYCNRPYCVKCGEENSEAHRRKADRLAKQLFGVRLAKWIITLPDEDCEAYRDQELLRSLMNLIATFIDQLMGGFGAKIAIHFRGDVSDRWRPHFEVLVPHDGLPMRPEDLEAVSSLARAVIGYSGAPNAHFEYIDRNLPDEDQAGKWWHMIRYAVHPTCGADRFLRLSDAEAIHAVRVSRGFRIARGVGLLSDRRIRRTMALLPALRPMPRCLESSRPEEVAIWKGGPCPECEGTLYDPPEKDGTFQHTFYGGKVIAPDVVLFEFIEATEVLYGREWTAFSFPWRVRDKGGGEVQGTVGAGCVSSPPAV